MSTKDTLTLKSTKCINWNFPVNRALALSLTVSFNGVSAALYTLAANSIDPSSSALKLLLNALVPLLICIAALVPILRQPTIDPLSPDAALPLLVWLLLGSVLVQLFSSSSSHYVFQA
ncbi:hypothetical protein VIGAN_10013900 [Vigna angularis var. angularis]|uniref:Nodulin-like domain-containing protein n=1 Tax=Vigna angularis var. angularis TaxID=157739 RepID=A0A0S3T0W9_PHAAN|nr:hypothetical protein VIGAN_10013900 [Vigna angularis var. angularis]